MPTTKKFATPLLITGSGENLEFIEKALEKLGYVDSKIAKTGEVLITYFNARPHEYIRCRHNPIWDKINDNPKAPRLPVHATRANEEFILALAAMVDDNEIYQGEWCKFIGDSSRFTTGKLYKAHQDGWDSYGLFTDDRGVRDGFVGNRNGGNRAVFKKATVDEIMQHFNGAALKAHGNAFTALQSNDIGQPVFDTKVIKKRIFDLGQPIAYEVIMEYPKGPKVGDVFKRDPVAFDTFVCQGPGTSSHSMWESAILSKYPAFFKPIFKATSVQVPYVGGELTVDIVTSRGEQLAQAKGFMFKKQDLQNMLAPGHVGFDAEGLATMYYMETFTFGCNKQYKGITRESIQKIIDLL